jgi:hypothetical protein
MNKAKLTMIFQSFLIASLICISVIFIIKYIFEVQLVREELENMSKENTTLEEVEDVTTEISADISNKNDDLEDIDMSDIPLTDRIYTVNTVNYTNEDLMFPCSNYNFAIMMNNSVYLSNSYPKIVCEYLLNETSYSTLDEYTKKIYDTYIQLFNKNFVINNELINTTVLTRDELSDMRAYYYQYYNIDINIEYAVLMESICSITYSNDDSSESLLTDKETEYFISYYYDGKWYMDYVYTDYYFYN